MKNLFHKIISTLLLCVLLFLSHSANADNHTLAFPGAEGYGKYTVGGNGGRTIAVTNLNDSGDGSLRAAVEAEGARTVIFTVCGNIELLSPLRINNDSITILGQTAPDMGICLKDCPLVVNASEVIVRYLRVRPGDKYARDSDALGGGRYGQHNVILDHLSVSWSIDECLSIYKTENITVQWCLVSHSLTKSLHTKGSHGFGGIWGGNKATFHHNLLANHSSRNPRISSVDGTKNVDVRNNAIYNWGFKCGYGGGHYATVNLVNNYYKSGPATTNIRFFDVADDRTGKYFISGNVMEGNEAMTSDNKKGVGDKPHKDGGNTCLVEVPFAYEPITQETAKQSYARILDDVGCSHQRDSYDTEVIRQVREGLGIFGNKGLIDTPADAGGWPEITKSSF